MHLSNAVKKISCKYRNQRRHQRAKAKSKVDKNSYDPGSFGITSKPENTNTKKGKKRKVQKDPKSPINQAASTSGSIVEIELVAPVLEVVHQPKNKQPKKH